MRIFETIAVAFSMFSAVPMPQFEWNRDNMRYALCAFPLIGILIGGVDAAAIVLGRFLNLPEMLLGAILCVLPLIITGGIHMDGAMDTWDALASHASQEKKLEILKDPHIGSFAVIRLCIYLIVLFGLWTTMPDYDLWLILWMFVLSRTLSGLAVASFPMAKNTGLAHTFAENADKKKVRIVLICMDIAACALMSVFSTYGIAAVIAAHIVLLFYYQVSKKQFGGITGDLAGWFLQNCELWMLIAVYVQQVLEAMR